jgi:hypothetical protein
VHLLALPLLSPHPQQPAASRQGQQPTTVPPSKQFTMSEHGMFISDFNRPATLAASHRVAAQRPPPAQQVCFQL